VPITVALDPHVDETYRLSTIGIIVFQVLRPSSNGGHSTLVDGFEAVRLLRESWPDDFELLTKLPITGERRDAAHNSGGQTKWYAASLPVIRLDFDGDVSGVRLNERQIAPLDLPDDEPPQEVADLAASFRHAVVRELLRRTREFVESERPRSLIVAGGVAANRLLRERAARLADEYGLAFSVPPFKYCGDNAAMIAHAARARLASGENDVDTIDAVADLPLGA